MIAPNVTPTGTVETPAMRGKRHRADELGERVMIARNYRYALYLVALALIGALGIIGVLVQRPHDIVYIERDVTTGGMQVLATGERPPTLREETIKKALREFVQTIRRVHEAKGLMEQEWREAFLKVTPRGHHVLSAYARAMDPFAIEGEIKVEVLQILARDERAYDIRWKETIVNKDGVQGEQHTYRGLFMWVPRDTTQPVSLQVLRANPSGVEFDTWEWSKE